MPPDRAADDAAALRQTGASPLRPADPRLVGPYLPLALLGSGGMGRVYLSRSADGGPGLFAVKVIRPEYAEDVRFRRRFEREAVVHARLSTPRMPRLCGTGFEEELLWMATAYLPGLDLADAVRGDGALGTAAVWRLTAELGRALADLADVGIVHRDLKPSNVLLSEQGAHIIDFGISKAADASAITGTGNRVGTPAYMSPEYLRTGQSDTASDVFSLAGTLVYAATGRAPFGEGTGVDVMHRVAFEEPNPKLTGAISATDPGLGALLSACLAKEPGRRPTPRDLVDAAERHTRTSAPGWPEPLGAAVAARQRAYDTLHRLPVERAVALQAPVNRPGSTPTPPPAQVSRPAPAALADPAAPPLPPAEARPWTRRKQVLAAAAGITLCAVVAGTVVLISHEDPSASASPGSAGTATGSAPGHPAVVPSVPGGTDGASAAGASDRDAGVAASADGDAFRPDPSGRLSATPTPTTSGPVAPTPAASSASAGPGTPPWISDCAYYPGYGRTRLGDSGSRVLQVQCILTRRGYDIGNGGVDGEFDSGTEAAVRAFQSGKGLDADGIVARDTWVALRSAQ